MDKIDKQLDALDTTLNKAKKNNMMALAIVEENKRLERQLEQLENIVDNTDDNDTKIYKIRQILSSS